MSLGISLVTLSKLFQILVVLDVKVHWAVAVLCRDICSVSHIRVSRI